MLRIEALDPLFFRDGKPFTMEEDSGAEGLCPPPPSVFHGALRRLYFMHNQDEFERMMKHKRLSDKNEDPTMRLKIKGVYIEINGKLHVPVPYDCVKMGEVKNKVTQLHLAENELISNVHLQMMLRSPSEERMKQVDAGLIDEQAFLAYLTGQETTFSYCDLSEMIVSERKIGIGRHPDTQTAEQGKLYSLSMTRLESEMNRDGTTSKLSFLVDYEGLDLPDQGVIRLGGEARLASYRKVEKKLPDIPMVVDSECFKLYLATPAMFKRGWLPKWIDPYTFVGEYKGVRLRLLTVSLGKYVPIGGFTMRERHDPSGKYRGPEPKVMRRAVPAGSVYYFERLSGSVEDICAVFHGQNISEWNYDCGMGLSFIGRATCTLSTKPSKQNGS